MMIDKMFNSKKVVEKALDAAWLRNEAISQNIANVDTPGYKRKDVKFEEYLNDAIDKSGFKGFTTDKRHIPIGGNNIDDVEIKVTEENRNLSMRLDGNNVDIEAEMAAMAKNTIKYNALVQRAGFSSLRYVITEGRK